MIPAVFFPFSGLRRACGAESAPTMKGVKGGAVAILRHKLGRALARLSNRPVLQATTGKTFLLRRNPGDSHVAF